MARACTICVHAERDAIDRALVQRRSFRDIARQFGVSKDAAVRHHDEHLPAALIRARQADETAAADDLLGQVRTLRGHALDILAATKAGEDKDYRVALGAIRELRGCVELFVKVRESQDLAERLDALEERVGGGPETASEDRA